MPRPSSTYTNLMARLEGLVRKLIGARFQSAEDIWQLQLDLLGIQVDVDEEISRLRRERDTRYREEQATVAARGPDWRARASEIQEQQEIIKTELNTLSHVLAKARSAGDALAWAVFRGNERFLQPLSQNAKVGSVPDFHSRLGVIATAGEFASNGGGFPLLHDITNILRIGDITFVHPDRSPVTVEIKTKVLDESDDGDSLEIGVQVWGVGDQMRLLLATDGLPPAVDEDLEADRSLARMAHNSRLRRQLVRMSKAREFQNAKAGVVFNAEDHPAILLEWSMDSPHSHWDIARELAAKAKREEFSSATVDGAMLYAATHTDQPVHLLDSKESLQGTTLKAIVRDLRHSGIFYPPPDIDRNILWFGISLAYDQDFAALNHIPFLLYPLNEEHIVDMLWGRLWFFVGVNLGKVSEELQRRGFRTQFLGQESGSDYDFLRISRDTTLPDGRKGVLELRNTSTFGSKLLYEFLSLRGLCDLIETVIDGIEPHIMPISTSEGTE